MENFKDFFKDKIFECSKIHFSIHFLSFNSLFTEAKLYNLGFSLQIVMYFMSTVLSFIPKQPHDYIIRLE